MVSAANSTIYKLDGSVLLSAVPIFEWREAHVIHALRIECGWQVQELAEKAGLNPSVIYRIEDGRVREPRKETLEKIARAFGVSVRELRNAVPSQPMAFTTELSSTIAPAPAASPLRPKKRAR